MPAQSKQQQKFMGIVRAIQKGDQPASKFSKDAQDAADDMKKKDVEDFASTKHKGLPKKVEQALREKIRTMVEDYVESCGYVVSAKDPNYKLKSPGGTGEEDRELKEVHKMVGAQGKIVVVPDNYAGRYGKVQYNLMKKLGYTGGDHNIIKSMDWGYRNYHRQKPNDQFSSSIILKSSPEKPFGDKDGRLRKKDVMRVITELMKQLRANKLKLDKKITYRPDRNNPMIEFRVDPKSVMKEGFGSDEFLTKTEKKKFEKERLENAEVLGYTLTGKKDIKEAITGSARKNLLKIGKEIKNNLFRINPGLKKVKDNRLLIRGLANTFMFMRYTPDNANYQNYKKYFPKNFKSSSVQKLANILQNERDTVRKTFFKQVVKENESKKESVFAVRQDKIKNGERFPKEPNFDYDPEKGKSRIRKVNEASVSQVRSTLSRVKKQLMKKWAKKGGYENFGQKELRALKSKFKENPYGSPQERQISKMLGAFNNWAMNYSGDMRESVNEMTTSQAKDTLNHLGGKRFIVMTGAKPLTIDKKRKELLFKIGRNAKGINLLTIRLTSLDLYDMEFAQVRMGNKKVKAVEKRVYGDQLQKFFKKHTGMNTYL